MRKAILLATALGCALVLTAAVAILSVPPPLALAGQPCQASLGPWQGSGPGGGDASRLGPDQRGIAGAVIGIGGQRGLPPRAWQIAIQAGMTESGLRNLPYGDRDSVGIFQMRASQGWGSAQQLADVGYQVNTFYDRMQQVPGWDSRRPGDVAQAVERSGFPQRYHQQEQLAAQLVSTAGNVPDPSGCGGGGDPAGGAEAAQKAIAAGKRWLGTRYAWGGGGPAGPGPGTAPDRGVTGFDCSSLVQHAYAQAGITLPRTASQQFKAGKHVPAAQAQPGDLLFWSDSSGDPEAIHHVALYLGNNQMLEAPQSGDVVKVSPVRPKNLVADATRPGV